VFYAESGPQICPESNYLHRNLDFQITQVSDCAIASAEISPAGAINIVHHCWAAAVNLLSKGVMVRGFVTRGPIYHVGSDFYGTGYHNAYQRESGVTAFKKESDEKGTPFIEIDPTVCSYIESQTDKCVRNVFSRLVKEDGALTALFPFKSLSYSNTLGGFQRPKFDAKREKAYNDITRKNVVILKEKLMFYVDSTSDTAIKKTRHYMAALDVQLDECDKIDAMIDELGQPYPRIAN